MKKFKYKHKEIVLTVLSFIILSSLFFIRPYSVTGGSMEPTLQEGQPIVVEKLSYHLYSPRRGELLVIRNPHDASVVEVKRVVGLPTEIITIGQNNVTVIYADGRAETFGAGTPVGRGSTGFFEMRLGPEDYMVLGDNRSKSTDSRDFGAVQKTDIIGRVILAL